MMINARELRIGNLLSFSGKYMAVSGIDPHSKGIYLDGDDNKFSMESPAPIPLTPEWLGRFGFKYDNVCEIYELNGIMLFEYPGEGCRLVELDREGEIVHVGKVFAHVH